MVQPVITTVPVKDARQRAGVAHRDSAAEGAIAVEDSLVVELTTPATLVVIGDGAVAADNNDMRTLPPGFASLVESLRPTNTNETIGVSVRFKDSGDSVKVSIVGYIVSPDDSSYVRHSLQEATATATARFDGDGFWGLDLLFPTAGAQLYQVRLEAPAGLVKVFTWTF